jgi:hypothetical protein
MLRVASDVSLLRQPAVASSAAPILRKDLAALLIFAAGWVFTIATLAWVHSHPVGHWRQMLAQCLLASLSALLLWKTVSNPLFAAQFVGEATAFDLGAMRAIGCFVMAAMAYCEQIRAATWLPASSRYAVGIMPWLYSMPLGLNWLTQHFAALVVLKVLTIVTLLIASVGYRTRLTIPVGALLYLLLGGIVRSYLTFTHNGIIPFFIVVVLMFTPCADGFSLDRWRRIRHGMPVPSDDQPSRRYAWARFALWCTLATCYLMAGMSKLRFGGWMWWDGVNLQSMVFKTRFKPYTDPFVHVERWNWCPLWAFSCIGIYTLITECGMALTPFSWRARRVWPFMAITMHIGIRLLQTIMFYDLLALQTMFINFGAVRKKIRSSNWMQRRIIAPKERFELGRTELWQALVAGHAAEEPSVLNASLERTTGDAQIVEREVARPADTDWRSPLRMTLAVSVLLCTWAMHVEFYPLTTIAMYSHRYTTGVLSYYWILQTDANGVTRPADLTALTSESKTFHIPLWHAFSSKGERQKALELLRFCGAQGNEKSPPEKRITRLEIQRREWDYIHHRSEPEHAKVAESMKVDF